MALTAEQEKGVVAMLAAFQNGKRINELDAAKGALKDMRIEVMDETGETHSMELADAVSQAGNPIAGRYWNTANATPTAAGYYGSLQALRDLPAKLGLGRYLVTDDRKSESSTPPTAQNTTTAAPRLSTARWDSVCGAGTALSLTSLMRAAGWLSASRSTSQWATA